MMSTKNESPCLFVDAGVHAGVDIRLMMDAGDREPAKLVFGNEELMIEFFDADSLERVSAVAAEGARRIRERAGANAGADEELAS